MTTDATIPTPRTDFLVSDSWTLCGVHVVSADFARQLEQELHWAKERIAELTVEAKNMLEAYNACNEDWHKAEEELAESDARLMEWFKAASPYATPGSLEAALRGINAAGPLTVSEIEDLRRQAKAGLDPDHLPGRYDERVDRLCDMAKRALLSAPPADDAPIDSTIKPSAWD